MQESTLHTGGSRFLRAWGFLHRIAHLSLEGWLTTSYLTFILLKQDIHRLVLNCTAVAIREPAFLIREKPGSKQASPSYSKTGQQTYRNLLKMGISHLIKKLSIHFISGSSGILKFGNATLVFY